MTEDELRRVFGLRLRRTREAAGLTQTALGVRIGVTATAVSYWETGYREPSLHTIIALACTLDTTLAHLLGDLEADGDARTYSDGYRDGWQACAKRVAAAAVDPSEPTEERS